jgi:hypothetical protein
MFKRTVKLVAITLVAIVPFVLTSCYTEDPGDLRPMRKDYGQTEFDRLEMGEAFIIRVEQGNFFSITARGDERNIDDLVVIKEGSTLIIRFDDNNNRKHQTYIDITMPELHEVNFSGASNSVVTGFAIDNDHEFKISLSGASVAQFDVDASFTDLSLSGASSITMTGEGTEVLATVSGASVLKAFNFFVEEAFVNASGASSCKVTVSDKLDVVASGASAIFYRGTPSLTTNISGGSTVQQD